MDVNAFSLTAKPSALDRESSTESDVAAPKVLIVSRWEKFAAVVVELVSGLGVKVHHAALEEAAEVEGFRELLPDVVIVDIDAVTAGGVPLYKALGEILPECQFILLCTAAQAAEAACLVRHRTAFDYLLADSELDPHRVCLLVQRTLMDAMPSFSEIRGLTKLQHRRILELLDDIKTILKSDCTSPVVKTIRETAFDSLDESTQKMIQESGLAAEYRSCVVDFICGKLRRLEREILLQGEQNESEEESVAADTILLVEDDIVSAELAKGLLERNGFDVIVAKSGDEAIRKLGRHRPSLVLMDVHLGASDGLRVVKLMRTRTDLRNIPVIVVTGDRQRETLYGAVELNIQGYLLKPYQPKEFIEKVKNAIRKTLQLV